MKAEMDGTWGKLWPWTKTPASILLIFFFFWIGSGWKLRERLPRWPFFDLVVSQELLLCICPSLHFKGMKRFGDLNLTQSLRPAVDTCYDFSALIDLSYWKHTEFNIREYHLDDVKVFQRRVGGSEM